MASAAEKEIRDEVVAWFHAKEPRGRVVHELPLSGFSDAGRADLGVIFPDAIVLVEIKSERDKLSLLQKQFDAMRIRCHDLKLVCHEKWFADDGGLRDQAWMKWSHEEHLWRYPASPKGWNFDRYRLPLRPESYPMLDMLWAAELRALYEWAGVSAASPRMNMATMQRDLHDKLTGRQVVKGVCAALRQRAFHEADPPVAEDTHA